LRAVVTDIDGTLTGPDRVLHAGAAALLRRLDLGGTPVVLATGNVLPIALAIHRSLGLRAPIVAENGGILYERVDGVDRVTRLSDRRIAWAAYRTARRAGLPLRRLFTDRWRETEVAVEGNVPPSALRRAVRAHPVSIEATGFATHIMERGHGKRPAVDGVLRKLGIPWSECLVAGDGDNDVGMLRSAGWAISFRSGSPKARRAADFVATRAFADGFVEAVKDRGVVAKAWRR
jgi:phosphoglycolate phosphatase (TIGR01487 family)